MTTSSTSATNVKVINIDPMGAPRMTQASKWAHKKYYDYLNQIQLCLPGYKLPTVVSIEFHIAIPKSYSKKKRAEKLGQYHDQKPDLDNMCKAFMDAWGDDDKHVAVIHAGKYWAETGKIVLVLE